MKIKINPTDQSSVKESSGTEEKDQERGGRGKEAEPMGKTIESEPRL